MDRKVYASDDQYCLVELCEKEKENYMFLLRQLNDIDGFYDVEENKKIMWGCAFSPTKKNYSIYDKAGEYCGDILIKDTDTRTPEIGIDLLENQRNRGIAGKTIKLLARTVYEERSDIEYFILRVSSENIHSRHMIEKLGAIRIGEEDSFTIQILKIACEWAKHEPDEVRYMKYSRILEEKMKSEDGKVLVYKLTADNF